MKIPNAKPPSFLEDLGDRMDHRQINASAQYWGLCKTQEKAEHPGADERLLIGLTGRRVVRLMFGVLLRELTRKPAFFRLYTAALANGFVREVGETLATLPFEQRVEAYNGLAAELAAGLGIQLVDPNAPPTDQDAEAVQDLSPPETMQ